MAIFDLVLFISKIKNSYSLFNIQGYLDISKPGTMKRNIIYIFVLLIVFSSCSSKSPDLITVCGFDEVFIADISTDVPQKVWSWRGEDSEGIPSYMRNKFLTTDECKTLNKGKNILITSSGGGVAYVERESGNTLFYASVPNAHSAEILAGNLVATASSYSVEGNRVSIYSLDSSDQVISSDSLFGAHGLYWDAKDNLLWALGTNELRSYSLNPDNDPISLKLEYSVALPELGGHDLVKSFNKKHLLLSTASSVWIFDTVDKIFSKHPSLGDIEGVKSLSYSSLSNKLAYVKAGDDLWWAYYVRFAGSNKVVYFPGEKIYKARWLY